MRTRRERGKGSAPGSAHKERKGAPGSESDRPQLAVSCTWAWPGSGGGTTRAGSFVGSCWCKSPPGCSAPSWRPALPPVGPTPRSTSLRTAMPALPPRRTPTSMLGTLTFNQIAEKIFTGASAAAVTVLEAAAPAVVPPAAAPPSRAPATSSACFLAIWSLYRFGCTWIESDLRSSYSATDCSGEAANRNLESWQRPFRCRLHYCRAAQVLQRSVQSCQYIGDFAHIAMPKTLQGAEGVATAPA